MLTPTISEDHGSVLYFLFWFLAGLWNVAISLIFWDSLLQRDEKTRKQLSSRLSVFIFGVGYWAVGLWKGQCNWMICAGIVGKCYVAFTHFAMKKTYRKWDLLSYAIVGDIIWAIGFAVILLSSYMSFS